MDLEAVRTGVAVADAGRFQEAAADLAIIRQAVSERVAALGKALGVRLFTRTHRSGAATTRTPHPPRCATTSAPHGPAAPSARPGHRNGPGDRHHRVHPATTTS
ncbi:LysR family transcriptional regulator [Pseudonocardia acidicola]|uniref:LysR family transcriptional regulator n=1 Tax=Pseudonocardia acidicola TaxID=2724939 RepID=A0ABX1S990_9PSEU|nr:LysR family transcriptional regulator [Pseudonocardia acidicola]